MMALWKITFAKFYEVTIEADNKDEAEDKAEDKACVMEEEEIIDKSENDHFEVWNIPDKTYLNIPLA